MNRILNRASIISLAATLLVTLLGTSSSSAAAEHTVASPFAGDFSAVIPAATQLGTDVRSASVVNDAAKPLLAQPLQTQPLPVPAANVPVAVAASSLEQLVATRDDAGELTGELKCLAGAIYFEARSESLEGQLAVGRVIIARARSGRFPASYCGVVYQTAQFSFMHGQAMPSVNAQSPLWQKAVAMARIADAGSWQSPAEGALFFHAARIATNWRMTRVAQIDHHIFYR